MYIPKDRYTIRGYFWIEHDHCFDDVEAFCRKQKSLMELDKICYQLENW